MLIFTMGTARPMPKRDSVHNNMYPLDLYALFIPKIRNIFYIWLKIHHFVRFTNTPGYWTDMAGKLEIDILPCKSLRYRHSP